MKRRWKAKCRVCNDGLRRAHHDFGSRARPRGDALDAVNNLSTFIFSLIRAVGLILLGYGILQVGLSFQSLDPSQRSNGILTIAGGIIIVFTKEILDLITE